MWPDEDQVESQEYVSIIEMERPSNLAKNHIGCVCCLSTLRPRLKRFVDHDAEILFSFAGFHDDPIHHICSLGVFWAKVNHLALRGIEAHLPCIGPFCHAVKSRLQAGAVVGLLDALEEFRIVGELKQKTHEGGTEVNVIDENDEQEWS